MCFLYSIDLGLCILLSTTPDVLLQAPRFSGYICDLYPIFFLLKLHFLKMCCKYVCWMCIWRSLNNLQRLISECWTKISFFEYYWILFASSLLPITEFLFLSHIELCKPEYAIEVRQVPWTVLVSIDITYITRTHYLPLLHGNCWFLEDYTLLIQCLR